MKSYELITILGPTASGKTTFAAALAAQLDTEIISADSRQIYRSMDIGTGKDLADYNVNGKQIPYHLIDICEPGYKYNVFEYQHDFFRVYEDMKRRGKLPILCGGTGMYIEAVLKGYKLLDVPQNPELRESLRNKTLEELETILASYKILHNKTDVDTAQRAIRAIEIEEYYKTQAPDVNEYNPINSLIIGIHIDRELRREKISSRFRPGPGRWSRAGRSWCSPATRCRWSHRRSRQLPADSDFWVRRSCVNSTLAGKVIKITGKTRYVQESVISF